MLIIHGCSYFRSIHGGGFISQSPEFHQVYLNDWVQKLEGLPIEAY